MAATDRDGPVDLVTDLDDLVLVIGLVSFLVARATGLVWGTDLDDLVLVIGLASFLDARATGLVWGTDLAAPAIDLVWVIDLDARAIGLGDLAIDLDGPAMGISISTVAGSMRILATGTPTSTSGIGRSVPTGGVAIRRGSGMPTTIPGVAVVFAPVAGGAGPRSAR